MKTITVKGFSLRFDSHDNLDPRQEAFEVLELVNATLSANGIAIAGAAHDCEPQIMGSNAIDMSDVEVEENKPLSLFLCERGNTLLVDEGGNMIAWLDLDTAGSRLEVTWNPENYPALNVQTVTLTDDELVAHINTNLQGWYPRKCNLKGIKMYVDQVAYSDDD